MQRVDLERTLTNPQRDEFEDMLRALTSERSRIKDAMGFALDNADAAGEVLLHTSILNFVFFNTMLGRLLELLCIFFKAFLTAADQATSDVRYSYGREMNVAVLKN